MTGLESAVSEPRDPQVSETFAALAQPASAGRGGAIPVLVTEIVPQARLDATTRARMLALMGVCYVGVDPGRFAADLAEKDAVILLRQARTHELVGFSTVRWSRETFGGREVEVLFSGDTVIHPDHWGSKALQAAFSSLALRRKVRHPLTPLYWFLLAGGYKTYLLMIHNLRRAWPRPGSRPPPGWQTFVDGLAGRWFGAAYDGSRGVVRFAQSHYRVRAGIAPIAGDVATVPDIAFYAARNPGHVDGDELVCLGELRVADVIAALGRALRRRLGATFLSPRRGPRRPRPSAPRSDARGGA